MLPWIVEGWNPLDDQPARSDDQVFELLAAALFQARFRPAVVQARRAAIRRTFAGFDLAAVAAWPDEQIAGLMAAGGMIRNEKKIRARLHNANDLAVRSRRWGSALAYLHSLGRDEEDLVRGIDTWAHYIAVDPLVRARARRATAGKYESRRAAIVLRARTGSRH
ncbi:Methyladenine glycosylase [Frateuria terrea]|uniref:Methyladenine glycosylase n=2 Tax=Frateuria terrea TaxID=529704 RepID=A0A1H6QHX8_9GAMM|nr:Methyladenine glycosylase [Frateuria terrea]SFP05947.1 Methyladenine glycosylase [Frateuria terrea]